MAARARLSALVVAAVLPVPAAAGREGGDRGQQRRQPEQSHRAILANLP